MFVSVRHCTLGREDKSVLETLVYNIYCCCGNMTCNIHAIFWRSGQTTRLSPLRSQVRFLVAHPTMRLEPHAKRVCQPSAESRGFCGVPALVAKLKKEINKVVYAFD